MCYVFVGGYDEGEIGYGGVLVRVCSRLNLSLLSLKFLFSLICGRNVYIFCFVDSSDYFFYGEEFYDCYDINEFLWLFFKFEEEVDFLI